MKKSLLLFATAVLLTTTGTLKAQDERCFKVGSSGINLGVGVGNTVSYNTYYGNGYYGNGYVGPGAAFTPAFTASYEYGIAHAGIGIIGAGMEFGFQGTHATYLDKNHSEKQTWTTLAFSPRATYHFDVINKNKLDIYAIVQLNIYSNGYNDTQTDYNHNSVTVTNRTNGINVRPGVMVAIRYFVTPNFGFFSELGYDIAIIKGGLTFKFGGKQ
ncbi:MAG: hypothetical protein ABI388_01805 [Bacteroidia bacterium]